MPGAFYHMSHLIGYKIHLIDNIHIEDQFTYKIAKLLCFYYIKMVHIVHILERFAYKAASYLVYANIFICNEHLSYVRYS